MRRCILLSLVVAMVDIGGDLSGPVRAGAQTRMPDSTRWVTPRTTDGKPDLQGVWSFRSATPLERPPEFAGQEFLSDNDVARVEQRAAERLRVEIAGDPFFNTPPWWLDWGTRVVNTRRSSLIVDPSDGRFPAMTPAGVQRAAELSKSHLAVTGPESLTPWDRCITRGLPAVMMPSAYNNNLQILQTPGYVAIVTEMIHEARIVSLDDRAPLPRTVRAWTGYSRGRWDGDTLVIETSHFSDQADFIAPPGDRFLGGGTQFRLVERLRRSDADTIDYRFTVEDPATWVRPWTVAFPLVKTDSRIYEYACHEGNYAMRHILGAARAMPARSGVDDQHP